MTTQLPWDAQPTAGGHQTLIWGETGKTIALVYTDASDAALLVRAVNSHAALVEALEAAQDEISAFLDDNNATNSDALEKLVAALRLAKEG